MTPLVPTGPRRITAYGVARAADGRTLLVSTDGSWRLPGDAVRHGEHPATAVVRAVADQTGHQARVTGVRDVVADADRGVHHDRIVFDLAVRPSVDPGPAGQAGADGAGPTGYPARWLARDELAQVPLARFTAVLLDVPVRSAGTVPIESLPEPHPGQPAEPLSEPPAEPPADPRRRQRFAAYALVTDPAGRILLTRIAPGFPGAGRWHLPGGGTDVGEAPAAGCLRELYEESGQRGRITGILGISHRRNAAALGPEGYPIDWHAVRVLYAVTVDAPSEAVVTEAAGGSTAAAAWFDAGSIRRVAVTEVVRAAFDASRRRDIDEGIMD